MLGPHTYCVSLEHGGMANCLFWGCREAPDRVGHHGQEQPTAASLPPHSRRTYTLLRYVTRMRSKRFLVIIPRLCQDRVGQAASGEEARVG